MFNTLLLSLMDKGARRTKPRETITDWIVSNKGLFAATDIISANSSLDKVSVYRTLELLAEHDLIHTAGERDGATLYEKHGDSHHHHIQCKGCGKNDCVPCEVTKPEVKGFNNIHHTVVMTGVCTTCS